MPIQFSENWSSPLRQRTMWLKSRWSHMSSRYLRSATLFSHRVFLVSACLLHLICVPLKTPLSRVSDTIYLCKRNVAFIFFCYITLMKIDYIALSSFVIRQSYKILIFFLVFTLWFECDSKSFLPSKNESIPSIFTLFTMIWIISSLFLFCLFASLS